MKDKISLYIVLTMIALLGCLGMVEAQPVPITPELHNELTRGGTVLNGAGVSSTGTLTSATGVTTATLGWNYVHATTCVAYFDGSITWLYIYPQEGGYWYTGTPTHQYTIAPACQMGYWLAFLVYNASGNWDRVQTYTYR